MFLTEKLGNISSNLNNRNGFQSFNVLENYIKHPPGNEHQETLEEKAQQKPINIDYFTNNINLNGKINFEKNIDNNISKLNRGEPISSKQEVYNKEENVISVNDLLLMEQKENMIFNNVNNNEISQIKTIKQLNQKKELFLEDIENLSLSSVLSPTLDSTLKHSHSEPIIQKSCIKTNYKKDDKEQEKNEYQLFIENQNKGIKEDKSKLNDINIKVNEEKDKINNETDDIKLGKENIQDSETNELKNMLQTLISIRSKELTNLIKRYPNIGYKNQKKMCLERKFSDTQMKLFKQIVAKSDSFDDDSIDLLYQVLKPQSYNFIIDQSTGNIVFVDFSIKKECSQRTEADFNTAIISSGNRQITVKGSEKFLKPLNIDNNISINNNTSMTNVKQKSNESKYRAPSASQLSLKQSASGCRPKSASHTERKSLSCSRNYKESSKKFKESVARVVNKTSTVLQNEKPISIENPLMTSVELSQLDRTTNILTNFGLTIDDIEEIIDGNMAPISIDLMTNEEYIENIRKRQTFAQAIRRISNKNLALIEERNKDMVKTNIYKGKIYNTQFERNKENKIVREPFPDNYDIQIIKTLISANKNSTKKTEDPFQSNDNTSNLVNSYKPESKTFKYDTNYPKLVSPTSDDIKPIFNGDHGTIINVKPVQEKEEIRKTSIKTFDNLKKKQEQNVDINVIYDKVSTQDNNINSFNLMTINNKITNNNNKNSNNLTVKNNIKIGPAKQQIVPVSQLEASLNLLKQQRTSKEKLSHSFSNTSIISSSSNQSISCTAHKNTIKQPQDTKMFQSKNLKHNDKSSQHKTQSQKYTTYVTDIVSTAYKNIDLINNLYQLNDPVFQYSQYDPQNLTKHVTNSYYGNSNIYDNANQKPYMQQNNNLNQYIQELSSLSINTTPQSFSDNTTSLYTHHLETEKTQNQRPQSTISSKVNSGRKIAQNVSYYTMLGKERRSSDSYMQKFDVAKRFDSFFNK